jgi:hypothetical protein
VLFVHFALLLVSLPLAAAVANVVDAGIGQRAEGDLALWHEGFVFVSDTLAADTVPLRLALRTVALGAALFAIVSLPLSAALFATLSRGRDLGVGAFATVATRRAGALFVVLLAWIVVAAVLSGLGALAAKGLVDRFALDPDPRRGWLLAALAALPFALLLLVAAAATDVAKSAIVMRAESPLRALLASLRTAAVRPLRFGAPYAAFGISSIAASVLAAAVANRLGGRPGAPAIALFVVGHVALAVRSFLRAAWIGAAGRLADAYLDRPRPGS